eukprot:2032238-Pyramimonas_sp.AAC.1
MGSPRAASPEQPARHRLACGEGARPPHLGASTTCASAAQGGGWIRSKASTARTSAASIQDPLPAFRVYPQAPIKTKKTRATCLAAAEP